MHEGLAQERQILGNRPIIKHSDDPARIGPATKGELVDPALVATSAIIMFIAPEYVLLAARLRSMGNTRDILGRSPRRLSFPLAVERGELLIRKGDIHGRDVLVQVGDLRGPRDRQHNRTALEHPGQRDLARRGTVPLGDGVQQRSILGEIARCQRKPWDESDAVLCAIVEHILAGSVDQIVAVLHRRHPEDLGGRFDIFDRDFAQPGMADDAVVDQHFDGAELFLARHLWIDAMQLPQADLLDAEAEAARMRLLDQILGPSQRDPPTRGGPHQTGLGGDEHVRVGGQRLANELLGDVRAVRIGSVYEVHAERGQALQRAYCLGAVLRLAPDAASGDAHGAEAETVDLDLVADLERAGLGGIGTRHVGVHPRIL